MHREFLERVVHHRPNSLGRIPLAVVRRIECEAKLGLPTVGLTRVKSHIPNESPGGWETHGKLKPSTG